MKEKLEYAKRTGYIKQTNYACKCGGDVFKHYRLENYICDSCGFILAWFRLKDRFYEKAKEIDRAIKEVK